MNKERKYVDAVKAFIRGSFVSSDEYFGTSKSSCLED